MEDLFFHNIDRYVYDECTEEEMNLFKQHMETCKKCRDEYELSCSVKSAMSSMKTITPPADFSKLVNERLDREIAVSAKPRLLKPGYRRYSAVAACLVLAAALGTQKLNVSELVVETSTLTDQSLQAVPDKETKPVTATIPDMMELTENSAITTAPVSQSFATESVASTKNNAPVTKPAVKVSTPDFSEPVISVPVKSPVASVSGSSVPVPTATIKPESVISGDVYSKIPDHLNPKNQVVLASSVEKTYEISGISPEDIHTKERDLAAEFALLETTNSGAIVANAATISSMEGVEFRISRSNSSPKDYGIGSGSLFVSSHDKDIINELLTKYISVSDKDCYFFTSDNFDLFIQEMQDYGVSYEERLISSSGNNVAVKLILS